MDIALGCLTEDEAFAVFPHEDLYSMGDVPGRRKIAAVYCALIVVVFIISVGIVCGASLLIRIVTGHEGIHDPISAGGTAIAFVFGMWVTGDFVMPWLLNILPTSLVKHIRNNKRRR